jgi:hypothetical protein
VKWYAEKINRDEAINSKLSLSINDENVAKEDIEVYCRRYV